MNSMPYKNFRVATDDHGVTTVTLDVPDRPLNVLDHSVMEELDQIVHDLENSGDIRLVIFQSGKESGFLAGADVSLIAKIDSARQAGRLIEDGQLLFQRIHWLPMTTVVVIHGPCLGGGLEMALSCDYRVARDNSSTQIGLPEIKLGLIPGWGGTQRLPKRVGLRRSLPMILTGKHVGAKEALQIGLIDAAISPDDWEHGLQLFIDRLLAGEFPAARRKSLVDRLLDGTRLGRHFTLKMAARSIRSKAADYPALASALKAIRLGDEPGPGGFSCERSEFVKLLATPTCRHLLELFFMRERARNLATWTSGVGHAAHEAPIRRVGIVGAGAMGAGIGQLAATRGFDVTIKEIDESAAEAGRKRVSSLIETVAKRKQWSSAKKESVHNRVSVSCDDSVMADRDLVIEAVVERDDVKAAVFGMLDKVVQHDGILSSNTSSLSVSKMAEATDRAGLVAGLHFFNPVHRMELVEVVRAKKTSAETIVRLVAFVRALGKTPIVTSDSPGFLVNRVLFPYLGEAILMVEEGFSVTEIDKDIRRFGMPMGPLELLDQVGLDVALHVSSSLESVLPGVAAVKSPLASMVERGHLGTKSGCGFYRYKKGKRVGPAEAVESSPASNRDEPSPFLDDGLTVIQRRLVYPMLAEAIRCLDEKVVDEAWAVDLAMVLGTGFAPHRGGPLHVVDSIGMSTVKHNLEALRSKHGERFGLPARLESMVESDSKKTMTFFDAVSVESTTSTQC